MIINRDNLQAAFTGFKTVFNQGFQGVTPTYQRFAMTVPSTTGQEVYAWLGTMPRFREWVGDRVIQNLKQHDFTIKNRKFENTIGIKRDDIEDDKIGIYTPMISEMGRATATFPDELSYETLQKGETSICYDGQFFFDTDHPVVGADGAVQSVSNHGGGAGPAWYLMDLNRMIKPLIWQPRRAFDFRRLDAPTDEPVFNRDEYVYGVDGRCNVGFGLWQLAYISKQPLTHENYAAARAAMMSFYGDNGRKLGIVPNVLVVPPALEGDAFKVVKADNKAAGESNEWRGTAEPLVAPLLG